MTGRPFLLLSLFGAAAMAAPPTIDSVLPAGGKIGTEVDVAFAGKAAPWPCEFWSSDPGVTFVADEKKERVGKIKLDPKVKPGPVWIRFLNAEGASEPRLFYAGKLPEIAEDEKAEHGAVLEPLEIKESLPVVMNGRLLKRNEADFYSVTLKKGQTLHVGLDGYALRSPLDPMLQIYDAKGARLVLQHDGSTNLDPRVAFPVPADGKYIVGVLGTTHPASANVNLQGTSSCVYRLHLATDRNSLPPHFSPQEVKKKAPVSEARPAPVEVVASLEKKNTPERIAVTAKKGESLLVKVDAFALGFETDPVLRIFKPDGVLLRETDDVKPTRDAEYLWKVSADGDYGIEVADRFGRAGESFGYRLTVAPPQPEFSATVDKHSYVVKAGASADIKVSFKRLHGHKAPLELAIEGAKNVEVELPKEIPEKSGDVTIKLKAKDDAQAFSGPLQIKIVEPGADGKGSVEKRVPFSLQDSAARGPFLRDEIDDIWLTVTPKPKPKPEEKKPDPKKEAKK